MHMVGVHNAKAGGSTRTRILEFSDYSCEGMSQNDSFAYRWYLKTMFRIRLFVFEHFFWLFEKMFGFMRVQTKLEL